MRGPRMATAVPMRMARMGIRARRRVGGVMGFLPLLV